MIYAEVILIDNFIVDMLICLMSGRLLGKNITKKSLIAGGLGSVYALLCAMCGVLDFFIIKALVGGLLALVCFGYKPYELLRGIGAIFICVLLTGGCVLVVSLGFYEELGTDVLNLKMIIPVLIGVVLAVLLVEYIVRSREMPEAKIYKMTAKLGEHSVLLDAFYDTGNRLVDLGGGGVVVADRIAVLSQTGEIPESKKRNFHIDTISGSSVIVGYYSEEITLKCSEKCFKAKGYIALADVKGEYNAVFGSLMMHKA